MSQSKFDYLSIFKSIADRVSGDAFKPEVFEKFLSSFASFIEEFHWDSVKKTCVKRTDTPENPYLIIMADLSGIQKTVYTISSKGALKSLRARSFMLELLCEHLCYELVTSCIGEYSEFRTHILFSGGGGLCIILPNSEKNRSVVNQLKERINDWAFEEFVGKLYVSMSFLQIDESSFSHGQFRNTWRLLTRDIERDKGNRFQNKLNYLFSRDFLDNSEPKQRTGREECQICHKDDINLEEGSELFTIGNQIHTIKTYEKLTSIAETDSIAHELCARLYRLGMQLTKIKTGSNLYYSTMKPSHNDFIMFPKFNGTKAFYSLIPEEGKIEYVWAINDIASNTSPFLYAYYTRKVDDIDQELREEESNLGDNASFQELARMACGADLIGCLRMDVDNMGKILSSKIAEFTANNLSRLSRLLNLFFKVYLNQICSGDLGCDGQGKHIPCMDITGKDYKANHGRNVSIVYAGGDDLFIVGAWDETAELAFDIQKCFAMFAGLGISGGLTLHKSGYPLYQMARKSGEAEHAAKTFTAFNGKVAEKNRFALFYSSLDSLRNNELNRTEGEKTVSTTTFHQDKLNYAIQWSDVEPIEILKLLVAMTHKEERKLQLAIPRGLVYKLLKIADVWWTRNTMYVPEFIYMIERIRKRYGGKNSGIIVNIDQLRDKIVTLPVADNKEKHSSIRSIRMPLTWFDLYLR